MKSLSWSIFLLAILTSCGEDFKVLLNPKYPKATEEMVRKSVSSVKQSLSREDKGSSNICNISSTMNDEVAARKFSQNSIESVEVYYQGGDGLFLDITLKNGKGVVGLAVGVEAGECKEFYFEGGGEKRYVE